MISAASVGRQSGRRRALGYCRVSTEHQEAGISIATQKEHVQRRCEEEGLLFVRDIVVEVVSGTKLRRTGLDTIVIPMAKAREFD